MSTSPPLLLQISGSTAGFAFEKKLPKKVSCYQVSKCFFYRNKFLYAGLYKLVSFNYKIPSGIT